MYQLVRDADVVVSNFRSGVMERIGFGYEKCRELNPRIIWASGTGFGTSGLYAHKGGQDVIAQAYSGVMWRRESEDDSSSSSRSDGSHTTSPVLSTTTLQTTPSPPPVNKDEEGSVSSPMTGAPPPAPFVHLQTSSLRAAELLRPIPYVPVTTDHMALYSREAFNLVRTGCLESFV